MKSRTQKSPPPDSGSELKAEIKSLRLRLHVAEKKASRLANFENYLDRGLEQLLYNIQSAITDFRSAHEAVNFYDVNWFKNTPISREGKLRIAGLLATEVCKYGHVSTNLWTRIVNQESDMLEQIDFDDDALARDILK
jgi:hypothetical protein